ncbi:hypothetical protein [Salinicoccus halitifaciens]|uniref:Uncharacterized protein n=1 Tax=Salinicoccus halitifaciens TaxID=1073415 RepID=A0ABV2E5T1_9STAP|nr:hypothetical protein [Salinicoccus halitifaciens]MCD2137159.1 hypothetical protein [Salinicoccus halitifaciens]
MPTIEILFQINYGDEEIMAKRKATKAELEYGIGIPEIEEDGYEVEEADDELFTCFASDEENDIDDDELIAEFEKHLKDLPKEVREVK